MRPETMESNSVRKLSDFKITNTEMLMNLWVTRGNAIGAYISFEQKQQRDDVEGDKRIGEGPETESIESHEEVVDVIEECGINLDDEKLQSARETIKKGFGGEETDLIQIAEGRPPVDGKDARFEWSNNIDTTAKNIDDSKELSPPHTTTIRKNDIIGVFYSVEPAELGLDVFGEELSAKKGEDKQITAGQNVTFNDDENTFVAEENGLVVFSDEELGVQPTFQIQGDLSANIGDIDYCGDFAVQGDVYDGLEIDVEGDFEVGGTLGAVQLDAGGDVKIHGGITGKQEAELSVGGNLAAKYISECEWIQVAGDIKVIAGIRNCEIGSLGNVDAGETKIQGGRVMTKKSIRVGELGSPMGVDTYIIVGFDFLIYRELESLRTELSELQEELQSLDDEIAKFESHIEQTPDPAEERVERLREQKSRLRDKTHEKALIDNRIGDLEKDLYPEHEPTIKVTDQLYSGSDIQIGRSTRVIETDKEGPIELYVNREGDIRLTSIDD